VRFTYAEAMTDPTFYLPLARAAESAGYHAMTVADSLCYPRESDASYPYTADGRREFLEDKAFIEPFALIAAMGAVTSRIRFTTFVLKLPVRPPVLVAKQAGSVAFLTGNRLTLGVGLSPWPEDFALLGVPWRDRGKRMDEAIDIVRGLTAGGYFAYEGSVFQIPAVKMTPVPDLAIPILVGGHSDAALRRAAVRGDGWMHAGGDGDDLNALVTRLHEFRRRAGTDGRPFEIHAITADAYSHYRRDRRVSLALP
jgi:probable F420-dependent oxidoreductase